MATADTTITNAYKADLMTVGTGSNMGQSDILEVFYIYNQIDSGSEESARILIQFDVKTMNDHRNEESLPATGEVEFVLKLYNAEHGATLPTNFELEITPVETMWAEGHGVDMEEYSDMGANGEDPENQFGGTGASWNVAMNESDWTVAGGDYLSPASYSQKFDDGTEDIEINITDLVEAWITAEEDAEAEGARNNYGVMVKFQALNEGGEERSYYTKRFFARGTQFFYKRPMIEAQWDSSSVDNRLNLQTESPFLSEEQNTQVFYYRHSHRGQLEDINDDETILPNFALTTDSDLSEKVTIAVGEAEVGDIECERVKKGVYKASFKVSNDIEVETLYEKWWTDDEESLLRGKGGSHTVSVEQWSDVAPPAISYVTSAVNLKDRYIKGELARIRLFIRSKDWSPTIYTKATTELNTEVIEWAFYRIVRVVDELVVLNWYGAEKATKLSYDEDGCYFDLDMDILETGWQYRIELGYRINEEIKIQPQTFKFRIEGE